jgi:Zn-dependent protease with chaperone function
MFGQASSRKDFLLPDLKLMLLPSIPFGASLLISDIIEHTPLNVRIFFIKQYYIYWLIVLSIALIMFIKSPYFIRHIWKTVILPNGEVRRRIEALAKKTGLKYKDILVWKIGDKNFANAGMAGLLPKSRYIFITDSLLENLSIDEIEAIVAHELGHIKYKHILTYMLYSFGYLIFFAFVYAIFHPLFKDIHFGTVATALLGAIATISVFFIYFIFIFRYFSRQFERQADLYAISVLDNPESFKSALIKVARINHIPLQMPRFAEIFRTHPSIFERLSLVDKAVAGDSEVLRYTNPIFSFRKTAAIITAFLLILIFTRKDFLFFTSDIHYEIGRQYANEGMLDAAINEFNKAVISNPKSSDAIFALGLLYAEKGAIDIAEKQFTKVLEINPKNSFALERLNQIQKKRSNLLDAGKIRN